MMRKANGWLTDDGEFFSTKVEAQHHETRQALSKVLEEEHRIDPGPVIVAIAATPGPFIEFAGALIAYGAARKEKHDAFTGFADPSPERKAPSPRTRASKANNSGRAKRTVPLEQQ